MFRQAVRTTILVAGIVALIRTAPITRADGFIVIHPPTDVVAPPRRHVYMPLVVKNHHVTCEISDTVAVTRIEQVFFNPSSQQLEGTYMFPMPEGASVQKFSMWMNGKEMQGEILDATKARQTYEDIVRKMRDPALLEYVGSRLYKARVFPIPANGDVKIALEYGETLTIQDGLGTYQYPLNTEKFSSREIQDVTITVNIQSGVPLRSVFSPSHTVDVSRRDDHSAKVGFEAHRVRPDKDFVVCYQMSEKEFGLSLLSYRVAGEDGFFMARVAPPMRPVEGKPLPKDICFVIDTSGSMAGEKIEQAKRALKYCVASLRKEDRFNVICFASDTRPFRDALVPADNDNLDAAATLIDQIRSAGGTDINEALLKAVGSRPQGENGRPYMIVFITDGEPTVGVQKPDEIQANVKRANAGRSRIFVFGVGTNLNAHLLDRLAEENRGTREYIDEKENIEVKVSRFFQKVADPALSDVRLEFGGAEVLQTYPKDLPDLFCGSELVVVGRYRSAGKQTVTIRGHRSSEQLVWEYPVEFAAGSTRNDFLPRLWANRKIGYLMDEIRLHGESGELKDEIIQLAKRYGIVTPYTSFLVIEEQKQAVAAGRLPTAAPMAQVFDRADKEVMHRQMEAARSYGKSAGGAAAVRDSKASQQLFGSDRAEDATKALESLGYVIPQSNASTREPRPASPIQTLGAKTFYLNEGRWIDSQYDGKSETKKVKAYSDEYFKLLQDQPELRRYLPLGTRIVVNLAATIYEIVE